MSKYLRTDGYKLADPKSNEKHRPSTKEKVLRRDKERMAVKDCPDYINMDLKITLEPRRSLGKYLMKVLEKKIMIDLLTKYDNNIEIVANCLNTNRRNVWVKIKEYKLEVHDV